MSAPRFFVLFFTSQVPIYWPTWRIRIQLFPSNQIQNLAKDKKRWKIFCLEGTRRLQQKGLLAKVSFSKGKRNYYLALQGTLNLNMFTPIWTLLQQRAGEKEKKTSLKGNQWFSWFLPKIQTYLLSGTRIWFLRRQDKRSREKLESVKLSKIEGGPWVLVNSPINDKSSSSGCYLLLDPPTTYPHNIHKEPFYQQLMLLMMFSDINAWPSSNATGENLFVFHVRPPNINNYIDKLLIVNILFILLRLYFDTLVLHSCRNVYQ